MENGPELGQIEKIRQGVDNNDLRVAAEKTLLHQFLDFIRKPAVYLIAVLIWVSLGLVLLSYILYVNPLPGQSVFVLSPVRATGSTDLCPGETLNFEFDVEVKEVGTYNLWMSTWKVDPPPSTIIFSEVQPFVVGSKRNFPIIREWPIPENYRDPANSVDKPMVAGAYIRDISVTAEGRNTRNKPLQVEFRIREDCPNGNKSQEGLEENNSNSSP